MSTREMAISMINDLTDEQLAEFIKWHDQIVAREKSAEQEKANKEKELAERRRAYEEIDQIIRREAHLYSDLGDNDKETLYKARMEKYGEGL